MNSNPLFDISQYQTGAIQSYSIDWRDATGTDPAWDELELHSDWENSTEQLVEDSQDNSTLKPTMVENETPESNHAKVEVVEELSPEEEADRQRLEMKVERAWDEAARALRELRDRRLYRNSHKAWEEYCLDRFGFKRHAANLKLQQAVSLKIW